MRLGNAHFEPLSQGSNYAGPSNQEQQQQEQQQQEQEQQEQEQSVESSAAKDVNVVVQSIEDTGLAGRAHH